MYGFASILLGILTIAAAAILMIAVPGLGLLGGIALIVLAVYLMWAGVRAIVDADDISRDARRARREQGRRRTLT